MKKSILSLFTVLMVSIFMGLNITTGGEHKGVTLCGQMAQADPNSTECLENSDDYNGPTQLNYRAWEPDNPFNCT
ncbi:MAG: hypothetical protein ACNA78_09785, partial [Balneolaceae bacterium]